VRLDTAWGEVHHRVIRLESRLPGLDLLRLSRTIHYLLRHPAPTGLAADAEGWFCAVEVARVVGVTIRRPVALLDIQTAGRRYGAPRLQVEGERIRTCVAPAPDRHSCPDLLFHAAPRTRVGDYGEAGCLWAQGRVGVHLSRGEAAAWRVAHRSFVDPVVLVVDAGRARRDGVNFLRVREGLYTAAEVPLRHVLNLREGFAEQASAGGFVVEWSSGGPRLALIRVARRSGTTWEIAKGKLEPGESPVVAAVREVREEMGLFEAVNGLRPLGSVRYGFYTREGTPRLKTIHIFLIEVAGPGGGFTPAQAEGIEEVRWFSVAEAVGVLAHPSLRGTLGELLRALDERARELGLGGLEALEEAAAAEADGESVAG
jgi:RNA:NAD 2'-phosphotransferase (TPT1/KptA family)/8-oxo-dGTP pyrophosphatase MutT (NUDIX family)